MQVFHLEKHQQKNLFLSHWKRGHMKIYLHRLSGCWEINEGRQDEIIQIQLLGGWYILPNSFLFMNYNMENWGVLLHRWFKIFMTRSGTVINSFSFFVGNKSRAPRKSVLGRAACTGARAGQKAHQQKQQGGLCMECCWELSAGMYGSQINCIA